jgi:hypothetical protein
VNELRRALRKIFNLAKRKIEVRSMYQKLIFLGVESG